MSIKFTGNATMTVTDIEGKEAVYNKDNWSQNDGSGHEGVTLLNTRPDDSNLIKLTPVMPSSVVAITGNHPHEISVDGKIIINDSEFAKSLLSPSFRGTDQAMWALIEVIKYLTKDK